jgi:hypothetical protein
MNLLVYYIDKITAPRPFGSSPSPKGKKKKKSKQEEQS